MVLGGLEGSSPRDVYGICSSAIQSDEVMDVVVFYRVLCSIRMSDLLIP